MGTARTQTQRLASTVERPGTRPGKGCLREEPGNVDQGQPSQPCGLPTVSLQGFRAGAGCSGGRIAQRSLAGGQSWEGESLVAHIEASLAGTKPLLVTGFSSVKLHGSILPITFAAHSATTLSPLQLPGGI